MSITAPEGQIGGGAGIDPGLLSAVQSSFAQFGLDPNQRQDPWDLAAFQTGGEVPGTAPFLTGGIPTQTMMPETETPEEIMNKWYTDEEYRSRWTERLVAAGWIRSDADAFSIQGAFTQFLTEAANYNVAGFRGDLNSVWEQLVKDSGMEEEAVAYLAGRGRAPGDPEEAREPQVGDQTTRTTVNRNVDLTNPGEARRLINQVLAEYLGRDASDEQFNEFLASLNRSQELAPVTTTSTATETIVGVDEDGYDTSVETDTRTEGGIDPLQQAIDFARSAPDFVEMQAGMTYMNALEGVIASPVQTGSF